MRRKFIRRNWDKYKRLGKGSKKKQKWRRPKGIHNKMRERREGYPSRPEMGMRKPREERGKIKGMDAIRVENLKELGKAKHAIIIAKVGRRKRLEIEKKAEEMKLKILNLREKK